MSTRTTRSKALAPPSKPPQKQQASIKKYLLNNKKPIRTAELDEEVDFILTEAEAEAEAPTEHYVLTEFKNDDEEQENEINFVLSDNFNVASEGEGPVAECTEEIQIEEDAEGNEVDNDDDLDAMVVRTQEIVEHVCGKCFKSFRTIKALKRHIAFCIFTAELVSRREEMLRNIDKIEMESLHMHKKDICFCCGDSYDTCHGGHINCADCPKTFKTQLSLERHMFLIHSEKNDFPCAICNGKIRTAALLELHMDQHMSRGKPFACKTCGKDFTRHYHLKRHLNFSTCGGKKADTIACNVCNKEFARLDNLRSHLKSHLGQGPTAKKTDYMCPCCKKCFYSLSTLNIHIRTHTGERPFDCDLCDKNFPSLVALKKHRRFHTGEKPYTCSVCKSTFAVKEVLNRHMKRHTGEKPHGCDECGKRFIQATQLKNHLRTHLRPYECAECPQKFKTAIQLEKHLKSHRNPKRKGTQPKTDANSAKRKQSKEYNCEDCNVSFRTISAFLRHEVSNDHMENAKKRCLICNTEHKNTKALQFHMLKYHETPSDNETNLKDQKADEEVKTESEDVVIEEYVIDTIPELEEKDLAETPTVQSYTIIAKSNELSAESAKPPLKTKTKATLRSELRKSMAECLRDPSSNKQDSAASKEEKEITENVGKLLDMLVDAETLTKFGWPKDSVEKVLCKVIENCGYDISLQVFTDDYCTRMREYVKLLFTVVIQNDTIKELLNNYPIDEVIEFVLTNENDDDD
ncbi:protein suppressor of hairy wing [Eupeodes corollae]|uniref:protein suppressor of hairy wing n=1 Tax=Eupeodes corollae TaxID=290404 RepID=UPI002490CEDC|nr:protein suppressor of hairy wing [Eupeodes corollae]XP_055906532.1 protein suppressor of hairy wing [Eupeodes corollae]